MDEREQKDEQVEVDQNTMQDLDVDKDDADKVLGGARRASSDPCEGGE